MSRRSSTGSERGGARLHLDCFSGIAGNMFLGAALDAGLPRRALGEALAGLDLPHTLRVSRVERGPLAARFVKVGIPRAARGGGHGRRLRDVRRLLRAAKLAPAVRERAETIFEALAEAEARVHGRSIDVVHFHEVGAIDAIVDIVGAAFALEHFGAPSVSASSVALGHGTVESEHGRLPLPAPATLLLLEGIPTHPAHVAWETVTPTGAAILRCSAGSFGPLPAMTIDRVGHGAGNDRAGPLPNVLRLVRGRASGTLRDRVVVLEANLDDLVPEHFDHVLERLLAAGALDVSIQHVQMKKNRPGFLLRVIARPPDREALAAIVFAETTTLGVRHSEWEREVLARQSRRVATRYGPIRVKIARDPDGVERFSAEYDDCKRAAQRSGAPLRDVVREAERTAAEGDGVKRTRSKRP